MTTMVIPIAHEYAPLPERKKRQLLKPRAELFNRWLGVSWWVQELDLTLSVPEWPRFEDEVSSFAELFCVTETAAYRMVSEHFGVQDASLEVQHACRCTYTREKLRQKRRW